MRFFILGGVAGALFLGGTTTALADKFWCGNRLIHAEMPVEELLEKCGEPDSREVVEEPIFAHWPDGGVYQVGTTQTEYWIYNRGTQRFPAYLTVKAGVVQEVELMRRGPPTESYDWYRRRHGMR
jgi:hypothetical protein